MRKYGRNQLSCQRYSSRKTRFRNKPKRVRQSNGEKASKKYENYFLRNGTTKGVKF